MTIDFLPGGGLALKAVLPLYGNNLGPHYWDREHEEICQAYWLVAELLAAVYHMTVEGWDYALGAIIIIPADDEPVELPHPDEGCPF